MEKSAKLGVLPIAKKNQYLEDTKRFMASIREAYDSDENIEVMMPENILFDEDEILDEIQKMQAQQVTLVLVVVGSWIYSSLVIAAANDMTIPFVLYGVSDKIATGNLGAAVQIKYVLEEMGKSFLFLSGKVDDKKNLELIRIRLRAAWVKQTLRNRKIATIGGKCMMMYQTQVNEFDWKRVFGIDFPQYDAVQVFKEMESIDDAEAKEIADTFIKRTKDIHWELDTGEKINDDAIISQAKMFMAFKRMKALYGIDVFANKCMPEMVSEVYGYNYAACVATCMLNEAGIVTACEADVPAAFSMYILKLISEDMVFFADIAKLNSEKNLLTFFNCGTAPISMADPEKGADLWPIPKLVADEAVPYEYCTGRMGGACVHFDLINDRTVTLLRVGGNGDSLRFHVALATTAPREVAEGEVQGIRWPGFGISFKQPVDSFLQHATGHHYSVVYGDWSRELKHLAELYKIEYIFDE